MRPPRPHSASRGCIGARLGPGAPNLAAAAFCGCKWGPRLGGMRRQDLPDNSLEIGQVTPYPQTRAVMPTHTGYVRPAGDSAVLNRTRAATSFCPRPQKDAKKTFWGARRNAPHAPPQRESGMRRRPARAGRSMSRGGGFQRCKSVSFLLYVKRKRRVI